MGFSSKVPPAVITFFGAESSQVKFHPIIVSEFTGNAGWVKKNYKKRISISWALKLKRIGVTHIALKSGNRQADFSIEEIVSKRAA